MEYGFVLHTTEKNIPVCSLEKQKTVNFSPFFVHITQTDKGRYQALDLDFCNAEIAKSQ